MELETARLRLVLQSAEEVLARIRAMSPADQAEVSPDQQGLGYATEAAEALTRYAFETGQVRVVCAHTRPQENASTRVLTRCGFRWVGEVNDPEDGLMWRWELA